MRVLGILVTRATCGVTSVPSDDPRMSRQSNNATRSETRQIQTLALRAAFQPATFNAERRTVEIVWTTGAKGLRRGWDGDFFEELEVSESAVRLKRLNNGAPLLAVHNAMSLRAVIGVVERAWIKDKEGRALVRFSERADADEVMNDVRAGILRNISVGYNVHKYEAFRSVGSDGKPDGGIDTYRAIDWEPMEISIVPIGFDDGAKIRSSERPETHSVQIITRRIGRGNHMSKNRKNTIDDQVDADQIENEETEAGDEVSDLPLTREARVAVRTERARASTILTLSRKAGLGDDFANDMIRDGVPLAEARAAIVDEVANEQRRTQGNIMGQWDYDTERRADHTSPEFRVRIMGEAIHARANPRHTPSEASRPFIGRTLVELARECLHSRGVSTRLMGGPQVIERALGVGYAGVSDFSMVLGDAVGRELQRSFESADAGVVRAGRQVTANDFRSRYPIRIGDAPKLEMVNEHGEFKSGTIVEASEPAWRLNSFGKIFSLTRQALINDDLGAFVNVPGMFGVAARAFESSQVVALLTSASGAGPTMGDGNVFFHSAHANLAASGGAINVATLGAARAAMRLQKNLDGRVINIVPKYLVVPASLETVGQQFLAQIEATKPSDANPFVGQLELLVEPRLDAVSMTRWYLAGDPGRHDGLEIAHLAGSAGPVVETKAGFEVDGVSFKVRLDFGCGFTDFRSWYANPGA